MQVLVRTDNHIENSAALLDDVRAEVESALEHRFADRVHRVDVFLQDVNGQKSGVDKRCSLEARLDRHQPVAVDAKAAEVAEAVGGAVEKLVRVLERTLGRIQDRKGRVSMSGEET